ncbi:hypothetical protein MHBO_000254 [Bonamia ostreae]|uniref:Uncharacterized protein n=1 Tax=Bonamia ostreae TaxID=126728 RepID=A0ABV2AEZ4_9EUKA
MTMEDSSKSDKNDICRLLNMHENKIPNDLIDTNNNLGDLINLKKTELQSKDENLEFKVYNFSVRRMACFNDKDQKAYMPQTNRDAFLKHPMLKKLQDCYSVLEIFDKSLNKVVATFTLEGYMGCNESLVSKVFSVTLDKF